MRKSRNSFFQESSFQSYNPNYNMQAMQPTPYQAGGNYYYQGPTPTPNNYNINPNQSDIESRLAKIERQINRMDYRISKLENNNNIFTSDDIDNNNSNMYMV